MFLIFLVARPILILGYTTATAIFNINATYYMTTKIRNEKIGDNRKKGKKTPKGEESEDSGGEVGVFDKEKKKRKKIDEIAEEIEYEYPEMPQLSELLWNFILMPIIMYGGFSRLIIVSERKKTF
jgi:hypothetical protein